MIKSNVPPIISGAAHPVGRIEHVEDWGSFTHRCPKDTVGLSVGSAGTVTRVSICIVAEDQPSPSAPQALAPLDHERGFFCLCARSSSMRKARLKGETCHDKIERTADDQRRGTACRPHRARR